MPKKEAGHRDRNKAGEEIRFDQTARADYLTGFHRRKLQRINHAKELAVKREKAERIEMRKKLRADRQEYLAQHLEAVNKGLRPSKSDADSTDAGSESSDGGGGGERAEQDADGTNTFQGPGDQQETVVTVDEVDVTRDGLLDTDEIPGEVLNLGGSRSRTTTQAVKKPRPAKAHGVKKFRYESKVERRKARIKQATGARTQANSRKRERKTSRK